MAITHEMFLFTLFVYRLYFREKISFFTRKGLSVPELPNDFTLPEAHSIEEEEEEEDDEDDAAETAIAINTALVASSLRNKNLSENHSGVTGRRAMNVAAINSKAINTTQEIEEKKPAESTKDQQAQQTQQEEQQRFEYVVDRDYGVEV